MNCHLIEPSCVGEEKLGQYGAIRDGCILVADSIICFQRRGYVIVVLHDNVWD